MAALPAGPQATPLEALASHSGHSMKFVNRPSALDTAQDSYRKGLIVEIPFLASYTDPIQAFPTSPLFFGK